MLGGQQAQLLAGQGQTEAQGILGQAGATVSAINTGVNAITGATAQFLNLRQANELATLNQRQADQQQRNFSTLFRPQQPTSNLTLAAPELFPVVTERLKI